MLSENGFFSDIGPKIRFLCYQKRRFLVRHFLIKISDSPILLENPDFLTRMALSENIIRKGFQFLPDDCVAVVTVAAYRRRKQRIKNTNQLALVPGLLDEEDAVVSQQNICM